MALYQSTSELIGATPLLALSRIETNEKLRAHVFAKLECFNPAGSAKDRVALSMIEQAEKEDKLGPGAVIIEPTSGNTGIGLACLCAVRGYEAVIVMPDTMSPERQKLMTAYGARVVLTPGALGMTGAIAKAKELCQATPGAIIAGQFENPANPQAHYETTGPEIWHDLGGNVDCFVAGVGTGGTITGVGRYLKEKNPAVHIVAVEPADSPTLSQGKSGPHGIQGIGGGFVPEVLDTGIYNEIVTVELAAAYEAARKMAKTEGMLVGISSGAALHAALEIAKREAFAGKNIVVLLPDTGERYLSTDLFI